MGQPGQTSLGERLRVIEAEIAAGQTDSALANCQSVFTQYPRALAVQRVLGEIYLAQRKPREALGALDRALAGDPEDARACCARAIIYQMHGDPVAALSWYRRACDARPDDQSLRATYFEMANQLGRPPYQPSRVGLARLYLRGGLFTHAIREWETLIAENNDLLEAQVGLVETLWRVERYAEAEDWARRVLANAPACVKPLLIAGIIARDSGRAADAGRYLQRAAELDPDNRIARSLFADRAMGDPALRMQFWGDEPIIEAMPLAPTPSAPPGMRTTERPQSRPSASPFAVPASMPPTSMPTASTLNGSPALNGRPSLADLSAALSRPDLSQHLTQALPPLQQPGNLPPDFHSMLKETENILWGPEHSDPGAFPTVAMPAPQQPAPQQPAPQQFAPQQFDLQQPAPFLPQAAAPQFTAPQSPHKPAGMFGPSGPSGALGALGGTGPLEHPTFMPPALVDSQLEIGDTEARRAIRWVQWLQAQGARMRSDDLTRSRPSGSLDALLNAAQPAQPQAPVVPPYPFGGGAPQTPAQPRPPASDAPLAPPWAAAFGPSRAPSTGPTGPTGPGQAPAPFQAPSAPEPAPQTHSDDLRAMFAQLETPAPSASVAPPAPSKPAEPVNELRDMFAQFAPSTADQAPPTRAPIDQPASQPASQSTSQPAAAQPATQWPEALADAFEWPAEPAAQPPTHAGSSAHGYASPDMTLEALEGAHASSGYQPLTLEPGTLAAFAGDDSTGASGAAGESARALETFFQGPEEPRAPIYSEPTPPAAPTISPTDYPARLAHARNLRDAGNLDEALVEYRALLKNAPDLLHDVKSDLEASLDAQPEHPEIHRLLGDARIRQGDYMAALESLNRSVSLSQQSDE